MDDFNDNILTRRRKKRYDDLPDNIKDKLVEFYNKDASNYQLKISKRKRAYPEKGDIFEVNPTDDIKLYGMVINNHINNINGEDLLLIVIFKEGLNIRKSIAGGIYNSDLFIPPQIVGKEYWTRGYFYNVEKYNGAIIFENYGFYSVGKGKFFDEYGKEIKSIPDSLGIFGVSTIWGIGKKINEELIMEGKI